MKDRDIVKINGVDYEYLMYYDRLQRPGDDGTRENPAICCPKCRRTTFYITYGDYECVANCLCGHSMTIYDG